MGQRGVPSWRYLAWLDGGAPGGVSTRGVREMCPFSLESEVAASFTSPAPGVQQ